MGIKDKNRLLPLRFLGSQEKYENAQVIIVGAPMDWTCSFRPGTRFGPQRIREASIAIEAFSFYQEKSLDDKLFFDCGDLDLPIGNVEKSLELIENAAEEIFCDDKLPIFLGGEHLISLPIIKQAYKKYGDELKVIHLDAHADLRESYLGIHFSHATVIRRVCEFINPKNIYQIGIRSGTKEELEFARKNTNLYLFKILESIKIVIDSIKNAPVYITLDIDVVDPAYADGTGTPEPGGCSSKEILEALLLLKNLQVIGFDLVEVSPPYDPSGRTAVLAAEIIREVLLAW